MAVTVSVPKNPDKVPGVTTPESGSELYTFDAMLGVVIDKVLLLTTSVCITGVAAA
jgi:hypothetical protein